MTSITQDFQVYNSCDSPIGGGCGDGCCCVADELGAAVVAAAAAAALGVAGDGGCPCYCCGSVAVAAVVAGDGWAERDAL